MNAQAPNDKRDEERLVKLYMDLTGTSEAAARSVFMHVCLPQGNCTPSGGLTLEPDPSGELPAPVPSPRFRQAASLVLAWLACAGSLLLANAIRAGEPAAPSPTLSENQSRSNRPSPGETNVPGRTAERLLLAQPLSMADAVNLALRQNPNILKAKKDLEAAEGIVIQTRAIAIPKVAATGAYSDAERTDVDMFQAPGVTFGNTETWVTQVKLVQSFYEGGRMLSSLRTARLTREQSKLSYDTTVADTVLAVELAFFDVLLAAQEITVQEASVELLGNELTDTSRRFEAGTVPRFNVLRAEVELANARPRLIRARNSLRIAKNNLANLVGIRVPRESVEDIPLTLSGKLEAEPFEIELPRALTLALERRTELGALRKAEGLRKEDIVNAKAGYRPSLQGFAGYDLHNSILRPVLGYEDHGWIAGAQMSWNLFDGLRTQGRVKEATANYERAGVELDDAGRRIELEVRTAHSNFIEAREVLESQRKVQEEAEEALRLARARSEAGTGTQLDVLSAQTALTEARTTQIEALHDYAAARARLERAIGGNGTRE